MAHNIFNWIFYNSVCFVYISSQCFIVPCKTVKMERQTKGLVPNGVRQREELRYLIRPITRQRKLTVPDSEKSGFLKRFVNQMRGSVFT